MGMDNGRVPSAPGSREPSREGVSAASGLDPSRKFRPLTQSIKHSPPESYGDCQRTCLAMALGIDPASVPHFADPRLFGEDSSRGAERAWLRSLGFSYAQIPVWGEWGMSYVMQQLAETANETPVIVSGKSPRGDWNHDVVVYDGALFDPHPDRTGLEGPCIVKEEPDAPRWFWLNVIAPACGPVLRDSDESPKDGDASGGSVACDDSAGRSDSEGIAR